MKKILYKFAVAAFALSSMTACDLDEYNPSQVTGDEILATFEGFKGLQSYCYQSLYGQLFSVYDFLSVAEGGTDSWLTPASNVDYARQVIYYDGLATNTNATNKLFGQAYSMIGNCNSVINRAAAVADGNPKDITTLVAEARCLRAFYYSILVNYYGNVTLNLDESVQNPILNPKRNTIEELYAQMIEDLQFAAENLEDTPYENNRARVTKKTALGLLARVYAQGGGEYGLEENGVSYWERARTIAEDMITKYGASCMYNDVEDVWAPANNRNNKEALFIAAGPDATVLESWNAFSQCNNILTYTYPKPNNLTIYPTPDNQNYWYGRTNNCTFAPSKYLLDCFDADKDKRWEVTFTTAYVQFSAVQTGGSYLYTKKQTLDDGTTPKIGKKHGINDNISSFTLLTQNVINKFGLDPKFHNDTIYPYGDLNYTYYDGTWAAKLIAKVWPKGEHSGDPALLQEVKNPYVIPYPVAADDDRICFYLSKEKLSDAEKAERRYFVINIDDLFENGEYRTTSIKADNDNKMYPGLNKFNWLFEGAYSSNLQKKTGDVFIMRMAEIYLLAAEANQQLGNGAKAAEYLNVLKKRAARDVVSYNAMKLTTATQDDVMDEYARELCGEYQRWVTMKRHKDTFKTRLQKGNPRAFRNFDESKHYLRPISFNFLSQIDNAEEYGNNGY